MIIVIFAGDGCGLTVILSVVRAINVHNGIYLSGWVV